MDEYRGRYETYGRREHQQQYHQEPSPEPPPSHHQESGSPQGGLLESFGIGNDWLDEYLPVLLILLGALGVYLWLGKQNGGVASLLNGFLK